MLHSLAVSDFGVGLLVQPLYITSLVMLIKENTQTLTFVTTFHEFYEIIRIRKLSYGHKYDIAIIMFEAIFLSLNEILASKRCARTKTFPCNKNHLVKSSFTVKLLYMFFFSNI